MSGGDCWGCTVEQTHILSVTGILLWSWLVQGVRSGFLQSSTPRFPHFRLLANVAQLELLLSNLKIILGIISIRDFARNSLPLFPVPAMLSGTLGGIGGGFVPW